MCLLGLQNGSKVILEAVDQNPPTLSRVFLEPFNENEWEVLVIGLF